MLVTRAELQAEEHRAAELSYEKSAGKLYYVKSAAEENYKTNRNLELPQHNALMMSCHPEDSMGGDLVEYPVVFFQAILRGTETCTR